MSARGYSATPRRCYHGEAARTVRRRRSERFWRGTDARWVGTRNQLSSAIIRGAGLPVGCGKGACESRKRKVYQR